MNLEPLIGLYWRRSSQAKALLGPPSTGTAPPFFLTVIEANLPWIKAQFPAWNAKGTYDIGMLDDALATLKQVFTTETAPPSRSPEI